jgi:hypothetical protein
MALTVTVECEYRLVINGKKLGMTRAEMAALRDQLSGILNGAEATTAALPITFRGDGVAPPPHWSEEDDATLRDMVARGKPFGAIAEAIGRTDAACRVRWQKIKGVSA